MATPPAKGLARFFGAKFAPIENSPPTLATPPGPESGPRSRKRLQTTAAETPQTKPTASQKRPRTSQQASVAAATKGDAEQPVLDEDMSQTPEEAEPHILGKAESKAQSNLPGADANASFVAASASLPIASAVVDQPETDVQAALQRSGSLSPYHAESFHHYSSAVGQQFTWPTWLRPDNFKDAAGRAPQDPQFNASTLTVPTAEQIKSEGHGTPMLLQYWRVKAAHFDKIAFFKVGKFYEIFYYDAFIANRICNLKWMNSDKKPHVGFPEMGKSSYAKALVEAGYKVVVVEQIERVAEQKERRQSDSTGGVEAAGSSCIERAPCEVFTKGTIVNPEMMEGSSAKFMVYLHFEHVTAAVSGGQGGSAPFAACLVDCATAQFRVARIGDALDRNALCTLLAQVQPSEVVYCVENVPTEVLSIIRRLPCQPLKSQIHEKMTEMGARDRLRRYREAHPEKLAPVEAAIESQSAAIAVAGTLAYLDDVMLGPTLLPFATWDVLDALVGGPGDAAKGGGGASLSGKRLVLDATALASLEIMESADGTASGSLLHFLDHTATASGHRLLKQWLCAPLCAPAEITARSDTIEFFIERADLAHNFRASLKKIFKDVDLDRETSRVWTYALQSERRAVMYEDITAKRLKLFTSLLEAYEQGTRLFETLPASQQLPARLEQICRTRKQGGTFPDLLPVIERLRNSVVAESTGKEGKLKYRPCDGADKTYDDLSKKIEAVKACVEKEVGSLQAKYPGKSLSLIHTLNGFRCEIECMQGTLPTQFMESVDITGQLARGRQRFQTQTMKQAVAEIDRLTNLRDDCIYPFMSNLFQGFYVHQAIFRAASRLLAEFDALLSLATASRDLTGASCRPELLEDSLGASGTLELRACRHPVAAAKMGASFVPNDTLLNTAGSPPVVVVTGPNMGGKSTVLRQTCIAVIMAQLGCRVNAEKCRLTPVDRIFTRIGSYDALMEGKSTLLTELEETASILAHGTGRSLAVIDELGRGTSTFDGAAIAAAVLEELALKVQCPCLFATHYHPVSKEAAEWPQVAPFFMSSTLDTATQEMTFLYRLVPGLCPASHGHNVARLAGLPTSVLDEAQAKSNEFEEKVNFCNAAIVEVNTKPKIASAELLKILEVGDEEGLRAFYREMQSAR